MAEKTRPIHLQSSREALDMHAAWCFAEECSCPLARVRSAHPRKRIGFGGAEVRRCGSSVILNNAVELAICRIPAVFFSVYSEISG